MNKLVILVVVFVLSSFSACTVFKGSAEEQVKKFDDWRLCNELADFTFKYNSEWIWSISKEIKLRKLDENESCINTYNQRIKRRLSKVNAKPVTFQDALNGIQEK